MFEPLGESKSEKSSGSKRTMTVVWIVVGVAAVVLIVLSLMN
jgi:hypothetical protein